MATDAAAGGLMVGDLDSNTSGPSLTELLSAPLDRFSGSVRETASKIRSLHGSEGAREVQDQVLAAFKANPDHALACARLARATAQHAETLARLRFPLAAPAQRAISVGEIDHACFVLDVFSALFVMHSNLASRYYGLSGEDRRRITLESEPDETPIGETGAGDPIYVTIAEVGSWCRVVLEHVIAKAQEAGHEFVGGAGRDDFLIAARHFLYAVPSMTPASRGDVESWDRLGLVLTEALAQIVVDGSELPQSAVTPVKWDVLHSRCVRLIAKLKPDATHGPPTMPPAEAGRKGMSQVEWTELVHKEASKRLGTRVKKPKQLQRDISKGLRFGAESCGQPVGTQGDGAHLYSLRAAEIFADNHTVAFRSRTAHVYRDALRAALRAVLEDKDCQKLSEMPNVPRNA
jgi:hypothetical protein